MIFKISFRGVFPIKDVKAVIYYKVKLYWSIVISVHTELDEIDLAFINSNER